MNIFVSPSLLYPSMYFSASAFSLHLSLSVYISFNNSFSFFNDYYDDDERMREKIVTITSYVAFSSNCLRKNYFLLFAYTHYDYDYEDDDEDDEEIEGNFHIYYSFVVIIGA